MGDEFATRGDLNGLGARVNKMEQFKTGQEKENTFHEKVVTEIKADIKSIFLKLEALTGMRSQIIGAMAVIMIVTQLVAIFLPKLWRQ